jgi:hypothetical protein
MKNDAWFDLKTEGYGWVPVTWQGWAVAFAFVLVLAALLLAPLSHAVRIAGIVLDAVFLIVICWAKSSGHKPRETMDLKL